VLGVVSNFRRVDYLGCLCHCGSHCGDGDAPNNRDRDRQKSCRWKACRRDVIDDPQLISLISVAGSSQVTEEFFICISNTA